MSRNLRLLFSAFLLLAVTIGCTASQHPTDKRISERVKSAHQRLKATKGGELLLTSIQAHGGLENWYQKSGLTFRWTYHMTDKGPDAIIDSTQTIDLWSSRAVHEWHGKDTKGNTKIRFGWDGKAAWITPPEAQLPVPPHFWSLTPYYFVGIPFVLADEGAHHELLKEDIQFDGHAYKQVKVTYKAGTGATPDDYYIAMIDPISKRIKAVRYIVTDPILMKGKPVNEKLITYDNYKPLGGIFLPQGHRSFAIDTSGSKPIIGKQIRHAVVSDLQFQNKKNTYFEAPK